jgi:acyl-CoA thioesterase
MLIDELLSLHSAVQLSDNEWVYKDKVFPKIWSQGRTAFGGVTAGVLYAAMQKLISNKDGLRAYTTNFVGPVTPDEAVQINIEVLRRGTNVTQILGRVIQNQKTCVLCQGVFGVSRPSEVKVNNSGTHHLTSPESGQRLPNIPNITPHYLSNFELSIEQGSIPFTHSSTHSYGGWMRYKEAPSQFSIAHLIAIIDSWPPTVLQMLNKPSPSSSVSWHIDMLGTEDCLKGADWLAYEAQTKQASEGYAHTEAMVYNADKKVIALSRQTIAVFA